MKKMVSKITFCFLLVTLTGGVFGQEKVSFRGNYFSDNAGTSVQSPAIELAKKLFGQLTFALRYSIDRVIIPPLRGLGAQPPPDSSQLGVDGVTGASRPANLDYNRSFSKDRNEIIAGLSLPNVNVSYYFSDETDYSGRMVTAATNFDLNQKNTNIAASYSYGWDDIRPLARDTSFQKTSHSGNLTITQVLSPSVIARIGADYDYVQGFQSNLYRLVSVGGAYFYENHPLARARSAVFFKLNKYFQTRTSINLEYRYYEDDWDIKSHTFGVFYHQYMSDNVLVRWRYRYYNQGASYFYVPENLYPAGAAYWTSDYKMEKFNAHLFGFKLEYKLRDLFGNGPLSFLSDSSFEGKYERYFSSNDFTADIVQIGLVLNY